MDLPRRKSHRIRVDAAGKVLGYKESGLDVGDFASTCDKVNFECACDSAGVAPVAAQSGVGGRPRPHAGDRAAQQFFRNPGAQPRPRLFRCHALADGGEWRSRREIAEGGVFGVVQAAESACELAAPGESPRAPGLNGAGAGGVQGSSREIGGRLQHGAQFDISRFFAWGCN